MNELQNDEYQNYRTALVVSECLAREYVAYMETPPLPVFWPMIDTYTSLKQRGVFFLPQLLLHGPRFLWPLHRLQQARVYLAQSD